MRRPVLHRFALAAAICVFAVCSLALKLAVGPVNREEVIGRDVERATSAAVALLEGDGFVIAERSTREIPIMHAESGACGLTIVFGDPRGFHRATVERLMAADDRQRTFYGGRAYGRLPVTRSWLSYYWWATLAEMGYVASYPLVEHVIIRPGCGDRSALLAGLRRITGPAG